MTRYTDWDYETNIATEYKRIGECNQCGDCCKKRINIKMINGNKSTHGGETTDGDGRWSEIDGGKKEEFIKFYMNSNDTHQTCVALGPDNQCIEQELGKKPWVCSVWPTAPSDIEPFENCSYQFVEVAWWEIQQLIEKENELDG